MSTKIWILSLLATTIQATALGVVDARDVCNPCTPQGATGTTSPTVGSDLKSLYVDLLASVKDIHFRKRWLDEPLTPRAETFCCQESLDCVNVQNVNIPMCYDKFTTNYQFPDGSYGSLTTGDFTSGGSKANLLSGQYSKDGGETGNIYANDSSAKPNTSTLSIPPQWTSTGVGSAIPASEIGSVVVVTSTVPGTTVTAPTTISATTRGGSVVQAQTISGSTTIPPSTITFTSTATGAQASADPSSSKAAAVNQVQADSSRFLGLLSALIYVVYRV
ncbi:hypothetical protein P280DRAFT_23347 [Massarina eburnea CBS 473.64]|uniref:Uncharacterized protein n=1 Tax=Massarina eburnea CBS 473.64 TaxID=1395130 RepID=A0A6A6RZU9_9PLEO|nr:hypothetical protein P280DRAFT_23347 [Massarina eburnea CBS 473.64]